MSADIEPEVGIGSPEYTAQLPRKRMAATVLFTDKKGRFLVCDPAYKQVLDLPGGAVERNESPLAAAVREVKEELGLVVELRRLVAVDFVPPMQGRTEALVFIFDGGTLTDEQTAAIILDKTELRAWSWSTVVDARDRMRPLVARRVEASLQAITTGTTAYLENGFPVLDGLGWMQEHKRPT